MSVSQSIVGKAVAIILVVFGHLGFVPNGGALGVSMFLVLSGYGMVKSSEKDDYKFKGYWKKRIISVYIPFFVWSVFVTILLCLTKNLVITDSKKYSIVLGMLGFPYNLYDPTMWYISYIFLMYLVFWLSFKFFKRKINKVLMCIVGCLIIGIGSVFLYSDSVGVYLYVFSFPIGVIGAAYDDIMNLFCKIIDSYKVVVFMLIITIILEYLSCQNIMFYILLTVYVSVFTLPILRQLRQFKKGLIYIIGRASFAIYLVEGIMMKVMWQHMGRNMVFWNLLYGILIISVGIVIHYIWKTVFIFAKKRNG